MRYGVLGILLITSTLFAQESKPPTPRERYEALLKGYEADSEAENKRFDEMGDRVDWDAVYRDWTPGIYAPRFLELAEANPADDAAVDALLWVVNLAMQAGAWDRDIYPHYKHALELLTRRDQIHDKRVGQACQRGLRYATAPSETFLRVVAAKSRDRDVRGRASLALARLLASRGALARNPWFDAKFKSPDVVRASKRLDPEYVRYIRESDARTLDDEADRRFEESIKEYGDILYIRKSDGAARDMTIADIARSELHELRNLAIGKVAPEIEGEDVDGKPMKLSEHRGKVVVLTFWASWCGPCMGLVPHERGLVERLKGKPFVLLGINGDDNRTNARKTMDEERITWRSFWNGGPDGPITDQWNVRGWPTIYVLDRKGTIRYKQVFEEGLDEAVDALLKELETP